MKRARLANKQRVEQYRLRVRTQDLAMALPDLLDSIVSDAPLDFMGTGSLDGEAESSADWHDRVETLRSGIEKASAAAAAVPDLLNALKWYVDNDDTSATPDNQFWLDGLAAAEAAIAKANEGAPCSK